ncbi:hypothetical protein [Paenibacillus tarimensis]|uniref:hypothetical protein n=1 Tax=Paenibacillus tarimensis TaxID=416012 RepID=UPI001F29B5BB|nr:hypothetical protein [Paenibacillus tarimensis]MCF2946056.1 hypothetical protein [Paenibacillus tarimensis]
MTFLSKLTNKSIAPLVTALLSYAFLGILVSPLSTAAISLIYLAMLTVSCLAFTYTSNGRWYSVMSGTLITIVFLVLLLILRSVLPSGSGVEEENYLIGFMLLTVGLPAVCMMIIVSNVLGTGFAFIFRRRLRVMKRSVYRLLTSG